MVTVSYVKPSKEEFRITKTDVKQALQRIVNMNCYKLTNPFQEVLNNTYDSIEFVSITRNTEDGKLESFVATYNILGAGVRFGKNLYPLTYTSNFQNTTFSEFLYTLVNTLIPVLTISGYIVRVINIDEF